MNRIILIAFIFLACISCQESVEKQREEVSPYSDKPNFLFCIADDWSFPHAGAYGDKTVRTPNFDRLAEEGLLFMNAFTASPSCAPSRAAILTGQEMWRLEEGGLLFGALSDTFPVYTRLLQEQGYGVGFTGKGYAPGDLERGGWEENPAGKAYQAIEMDAPEGIRNTDYAGNFAQFLAERDSTQPFCFWYGASEPHRRYEYGIGEKEGYDLDQVNVPGFLPDTKETRNDVADYYFEVEWFDKHLGRMIHMLEDLGDLENTLIVVTSDNGMPFPRAKSNLYHYGVHMPLLIHWGKEIEAARTIENPVSLSDIAPTFLDLAGVEKPLAMTGKSLAPLLVGEQKEAPRDFVVTGLERHTLARPNKKGYPIRAIHTKEYSYIYNFEPGRWPAGDPDFDAWPQGIFGDIDGGASKSLLLADSLKWREEYLWAMGKRPQEELYNTAIDPYQISNIAGNPSFQEEQTYLKQLLFKYLEDTGDPRSKGESPWDEYPYSGGPKEQWMNL